MPYLCRNCGEKRDFKRFGWESGTCRYNQNTEEEIDENGDIVGDTESYDTEYENYESSDSEIDRIQCSKCNNRNVEDVSDEEWGGIKKVQGKLSDLKKRLLK